MVVLTETPGGQIPLVQVNALGDAVPALVLELPLPLAVGFPPVARICPIASPVAEATVIWFDPGVTRVAVTPTVGWMRVNVAFVGKVVLLLPKAPLKVTTFPEIDTIVSWVPVWNMP